MDREETPTPREAPPAPYTPPPPPPAYGPPTTTKKAITYIKPPPGPPSPPAEPEPLSAAAMAAQAALTAASSGTIAPPPTPAAPPPAAPPAAPTAPEPAPTAPEPPDVATRLANAESRDEIADAVLDAAASIVQRAALFIAQAEGILGWAAKPEPPEELRSFSLSYNEPSLFASLRNTDGFYVGPMPELAGNRRMLDALGSSGTPTVALVPVTLKGKSVLFLLGEAAAGSAPPPVPELKRLAAMTAIALEVVLLKNKLRNL